MGNDIKFEAWHMAALMLGYNQLAKEQDVLGSKVFCRLARDAARKSFLELGGTLESETRDEVILRLDAHVPHVEFGARDIELMRKCVTEHDAKAAVPDIDYATSDLAGMPVDVAERQCSYGSDTELGCDGEWSREAASSKASTHPPDPNIEPAVGDVAGEP